MRHVARGFPGFSAESWCRRCKIRWMSLQISDAKRIVLASHTRIFKIKSEEELLAELGLRLHTLSLPARAWDACGLIWIRHGWSLEIGSRTRCSEFGSGHLTLVLGCGSTSQAEPPVLHGWLGEDILDGGRSMSDYSGDDRGTMVSLCS